MTAEERAALLADAAWADQEACGYENHARMMALSHGPATKVVGLGLARAARMRRLAKAARDLAGPAP